MPTDTFKYSHSSVANAQQPRASATIIRVIVATALLLGAGGVWALATQYETRIGPAQEERNWVVGYLHDGHSFGQIMRLRLEGLTGIDLWLQQPVTPGSGAVTIELRRLADQQVVATSEIPVAALAARGPTTFTFAVVETDRRAARDPVPLALILRTHEVNRDSAVSVMAGGNRYGGGAILLGENLVPGADLFFRARYQARVIDRVLPITQIAYARPGIFGWPPLYALLAYGLLVGLTLFFIALVRATASRGAAPGEY
jgi:hypothetical protein